MPATDTVARLGTSELELTRTGLGTWAMGGAGWAGTWGPQDDDLSVATILRAVEAGVNWVDTAAEYGLGHAEEVVARALALLPETDRPYVFTKCGMLWDPAEPMRDARPAADARSVRAECEASLRRLGVERLDMLQVHWPPAGPTPVEEYWSALVDLRREGKIRLAGLSNHDVAALERAEAVGHVDSIQPPLSLVNRSAVADLLPWCVAHGTGVIAYSPLCSGLLTGRYRAADVEALPAGDWRRAEAAFTTQLYATLALGDELAGVAADTGSTPVATAIAWVLACEGVTAAIVGARRPSAVDGWVGVVDGLGPGAIERLADAVARTGAGTGPPLPFRSPVPATVPVEE